MLNYKLDYSIERDIDRLDSVRRILDTMDTAPRPKDLELMATYLLYGKDENGKNSMQRKEVYDTNKRHSTFRTKNQKEQSLDAILEDEKDTKHNITKLGEKFIYKIPKQSIDPEDRNLGNGLMAELQDAIARIDHSIKAAEGKVDPNPDDTQIQSQYHLYLLKHILIDMRRHQYYIKDAYKPAIHFLAADKPQRQFIDWGGPIHMRGFNGATVELDYENYKHIAHIIRNYSDIAMEGWDDPLGWEKTIIYDFDRYVDMAKLPPEKQYILEARIDKLTNIEIQHQVAQRFGKSYTVNYISLLLSEKIPLAISAAAKRHRLGLDKNFQHAQCSICGADHPDHPLFFLEPNKICKECVRRRRQWQKKEHA